MPSSSKRISPAKPATKSAKPRRPFAVRNSKIHGKGVFATATIRKGRRLIEYVGRRIPETLADEVYAEEDGKPSHTFLFALDNGDVIDATVGGNDSRWINHSCAPNCEAVGEDADGEEHIFIEAIRSIKPGEELAYDYSFEFDEPHTKKLEKQYPCRCGSPECRGTILVEKKEKKPKKAKKAKKAK
ncbi:MAG: SET domain-containing protein-lysine N-methyltransferase [Proteobacteria bacterium]|nr:SET domain-containing protein-lysine N-methyltransferase [Pseudomonadota bacterium]